MSKVLFVEDEKMAAWLSKKNLEQLKHTVDIAETAKDAIEKFKAVAEKDESKYDIVFMDAGLPEGPEAGVKVIEEIRAYEEEKRLDPTPIVGVSANEAGEMKEKMVDAGANDYFVKPVMKDQLQEIIEEQLERKMGHGLTK